MSVTALFFPFGGRRKIRMRIQAKNLTFERLLPSAAARILRDALTKEFNARTVTKS